MNNTFQRLVLIFITNFVLVGMCFGQQKTRFISSEFMVGKIVPNYKSFPGSGIRKSMVVNLGVFLNDSTIHSHQYYHYPLVGVSIGVSDLGNKENLGTEFSLVPFISLNVLKDVRHSLRFKLGLGASYFTKHYQPETNPFNKAIGSSFTWTFQGFINYHVFVNDQMSFQAGAGFWHSSNSHMQIPNFGLNSAMVSAGFSYYLTRVSTGLTIYKHNKKLPTQKFIQFRFGNGWHEFGATVKPIGGPKYPVFTLSGDYGVLLNQQLKLYGGVFYRFYKSFYHYITDNYPDEQHPILRSSNINFHIGCEYLLGHVGMNAEGGINLFKPFYSEFYDIYEEGDDFNKFRMSTFNTRLGINLYLKSTSKDPSTNLALGTHINANFGKADFGELSLTYIKRLGRK